MKLNPKFFLFAVVAAALCFASAKPVDAAPLITGISAKASSQFLPDGRLAIHAVNGNGLIGNDHVSVPPGGNMWLSDGSGSVGQSFSIDLGALYDVENLRVWNYNENANPTCCLARGIQTANISLAGADGIFGAPIPTNFSIAPGTQTDFSEIVALGGAQAQLIKFDVISTHGDAAFVGLSEVQVTGDLTPGQELPIPTTISDVSSNLSGFDRLADYVVDRSGMFGSTHSIGPDATMWLNQGTFGDPLLSDQDPEITFDLGSVQAVDRMKVWNYNEQLPNRTDLLPRGIASADILVSDDGNSFTTHLSNVQFAIAPGTDAVDFGQVVDLQGVSARFIKFDILSNHHGRDFTDPLGDDGNANFAGLSEVQFFQVPEPSTFCLLALSLFGLFIARRRRK